MKPIATIPVYIVDQSTMSQLSLAVRSAGLHLQAIGIPKANAEALEQDWKCCYAAGDLFFFGTGELNDKNAFRLKAGTLCLIVGPGARGRRCKEINATYGMFEDALLSVGARKIQ